METELSEETTHGAGKHELSSGDWFSVLYLIGWKGEIFQDQSLSVVKQNQTVPRLLSTLNWKLYQTKCQRENCVKFPRLTKREIYGHRLGETVCRSYRWKGFEEPLTPAFWRANVPLLDVIFLIIMSGDLNSSVKSAFYRPLTLKTICSRLD